MLADHAAAELYWLAFLLMGHVDVSVDLTVDAVSHPGLALALSRRRVMAKALAAVRDELIASALRTAWEACEDSPVPPDNWSLDPKTTKVDIEHALLAIDLFPRCALLLTVFEDIGLEDASALLDVDAELVRKGQIIGLLELTANLAKTEDFQLNATNRQESHLIASYALD